MFAHYLTSIFLQLSVATLATTVAGIVIASSGKKEAKAAPAINAESPQEEDFIK